VADFNCNLQVIQSSKFGSSLSPTYADVSDTPETVRPGIIRSPGVIPIKRTLGAPATTKWRAWSTSSDISGYRKLLTADVGATLTLVYGLFTSTGGSYPEYSALEEFATDTGGMDKVFANTVATTFAATAWKDAGGLNDDVYLEVYIYHRTPGGVETEIAAYTEFINVIVLTQFTETVTLARKWDTGDRLVVKYRFRNDGPTL